MPWPDYQHQLPPDTYPRDEGDYRRRQWDDFDYRDPPFRGRSRSPVDDGRKRRRSTSPWDRSRYEPRPRYGDDRDFRRDDGGGPGRGGYGRGGRASRPPPPNPYELDYVVQLKHFAEWFRFAHPDIAMMEDRVENEPSRDGDGTRPKDGIRVRWEKYKRDFAISQVTIMFDFHKNSPWFAEKYNPSEEFASLRLRVRKQGWKGRLSQSMLELEEGKYDPPIAGSTNGEIPLAKEVIVDSPVVSKMEQDDSKQPEEDIAFGMEEDDTHGEPKLEADPRTPVESKRTHREENVSVLPEGNEVMIRTIPPDIGRVKLEEACSTVPGFVHLALGEPLQKRNFYRAGWIKFQDDTDMEKAVAELSEKKVDGFKLHVTHTTRPFITRARMTPEVASHPERVKKDLSQIKALAAILEDEAAALRQLSPMQTHPDHLGPDGPPSDGTQVKPEQPANGHGGIENEREPELRGSDLVEQRVEKILAQQLGEGPEDRLGREYRRNIISLDLYRAYLRTAFNTCYYCAAVTDHVEELQRKCVKHTRKPLSAKTVEDILAKTATADVSQGEAGEEIHESEKHREIEGDKLKSGEIREWKRNDERWLEWVDNKLALLLRRDKIDPRDYGGKDYEEELSKACEQHIKQEDEGKFRCKQCNKLFKAISFVEKHVANKHPEAIKYLEELPYYSNFALDPHRMQPFSHPPQPAGSGSALPPQAYGLKGTSLAPPLPDYRDNRGIPPYGLPAGVPPPPPYGALYGGVEGGFGSQWGAMPQQVPANDHKGLPNRLSDRIGDVDAGGKGFRAPPPDVREDPRAMGGRKISYHDIDKAAAGDDVNIELSY